MDLSVNKFMDRHLEGQTKAYQFFVARVYLRILPLILTRAFPTLIAGLYNGAVGTKERRINSFLRGSRMWGETVQSMTKAKIHAFNELNIPSKGHLIFSNHVNELDFPFDCYFICKPYLANQVIKKTLFAYWWMKAMGSEVFDNRSNMSIAVSVKNLRKGIKDNSYIVYPEGRNTYSEEIQPLKKGMCKLAFDNKLPIVIILKSGIASFQEYQKGNTIGYYSCGIVDPTGFSDWDSLRAHVQDLMVKGKSELDRLTAELRNQS